MKVDDWVKGSGLGELAVPDLGSRGGLGVSVGSDFGGNLRAHFRSDLRGLGCSTFVEVLLAGLQVAHLGFQFGRSFGEPLHVSLGRDELAVERVAFAMGFFGGPLGVPAPAGPSRP